MRIAYDYQIFAAQKYGGISRYFANLASHLHMREQVRIFAPLHRNGYIKSMPAELVDGCGVEDFYPKTARLVNAYNKLVFSRKIKNWQPSIIHQTYYSSSNLHSNGYQTVVTVYDLIHELFSEQFHPRDKTVALKKKAVERADHIICISENTKVDLMRLYGIPEEKITVIYLGFDNLRDGVSEVMRANTAKPYLLYVGDRAGYKNFSTFIKAYASSRKLKQDFDVVAFGGGKFSNAEIVMINSLGLSSKQIHQFGGDDLALGNFYANASAFIYPSKYEGFGIPPLEAMSLNCPVISSNTSSMPEVIGAAAQYFDPTDVGDMVDAIESVLYSSVKGDTLKQLGREQLKKFSWEKCSIQTLAVYKSLVAEA